MNQNNVKWAIFHICYSIQRVSGTKYSTKGAMRQVLKELNLFGHDLSCSTHQKKSSQKTSTMAQQNSPSENSRFNNWITRFHVASRYKTMMSMSGMSGGRIY